jgi:integrase
MPEPKFDEEFKTWRKREWVRVPGKKPVRVIASGKTPAKCKKEFERKRLEEITRLDLPAAPKEQKAFAAFAADWLSRYPDLVANRENTRIEKAYHLRIHLLPFFERLAAERGGAPYRLTEISEEVLDRFASELAKTPRASRAKQPTDEPAPVLSSKSVANIMQTIRKMLTTAKRWKLIDAVPEISHVKVTRPKFDFFDFAEADRLLSKISNDEDLALVMTKVRLGLRASELLGLRWDRVDLPKREVRIDQQIARGSHKLVPVKAGERSLPIPPRLLATLKGIKHLRGPWVFCDADGRPYSLGHLRKTIAKWCRRAELREMHPHGLRHTFASHLVMKGVPIIQVKEWLGHGSVNMTMRYAHLAPRAGASMIDMLEEPVAHAV